MSKAKPKGYENRVAPIDRPATEPVARKEDICYPDYGVTIKAATPEEGEKELRKTLTHK
jgi:hypothetical protein